MGQHTHVVHLGSDRQSAMMTLINAAIQFHDLSVALAKSDAPPELQWNLDDLLKRTAEFLVLPLDLTEEVLRGAVKTTVEGSVLQLHFTSEQFDRPNLH